MAPRINRAKTLGCHAVEPDNTDCFDNQDCWGQMTNPSVSSGSTVKAAQVAYNKWFAQYCHQKGLAVALKNTRKSLPSFLPSFFPSSPLLMSSSFQLV
jgi:hypothetical protein